MLCEKCKKKKATLYYSENISGQRRSFHLCAECTSLMEASGELESLSIAFSHFESPFSLWEEPTFTPSSVSLPQTQSSEATEYTCPLCGIQFKEIAATGKVGCAKCYSVFSSRLAPLMRSVHGNNSHTGGSPLVYRRKAERLRKMTELRAGIKTAVSLEAYEEAARLRDELRQIEKETYE